MMRKFVYIGGLCAFCCVTHFVEAIQTEEQSASPINQSRVSAQQSMEHQEQTTSSRITSSALNRQTQQTTYRTLATQPLNQVPPDQIVSRGKRMQAIESDLRKNGGWNAQLEQFKKQEQEKVKTLAQKQYRVHTNQIIQGLNIINVGKIAESMQALETALRKRNAWNTELDSLKQLAEQTLAEQIIQKQKEKERLRAFRAEATNPVPVSEKQQMKIRLEQMGLL